MQAINLRAAISAANDITITPTDALVETSILKQLIESCKARVEQLEPAAKSLAEHQLAEMGVTSGKFMYHGHHYTLDCVPVFDLIGNPNKYNTPEATILICPGGGNTFTSTGNEGIDVANYFVPRGYNIAVLKYRLPNGHEYIPLEDACRAMEILRDSISTWRLSSQKIAVMGFSAGGHLAASLLTRYTGRKSRPDCGVLVYPVISMDSTITHKGSCKQLLGSQPTDEQRLLWSAEKQVTTDTPPCLLVACQDDPTVKIENSIRFYQALTAANVPASLVLVPVGKHGWGYSRQFVDRELIDLAILSFLEKH